MIDINLKVLEENAPFQKNVLYRIEKARTVQFIEKHGERKELVNLEYGLCDGQYGIFSHEYRSPSVSKQRCKTADILACVIDEVDKRIYTTIADVKSNISAFSDDLLKDNAMLTAIKEVRDFIEQLHAEILHKNSFLLYYKDSGYIEYERLGIVTKNFEHEKFLAVAEQLEQLFRMESPPVPMLVALKLKKNLAPYMNEADRLRDFAARKVKISGRDYHLHVFLLNKINELEYASSVKISAENHLVQ